MNPKHKNPQELHPGRFGEFWAHAPYNFVPLPEKVVTVSAVPKQDAYTGHSGYIECTLTTQSPIYTRSAMTVDEFRELKPDEQRNRPRFFSIKQDEPVIPGSTLRGMVRSLVEIAGYGKVQWVADRPLVFRAVGDTTSLGNYYRDRLMRDDGGKRYTPLMQAGYLEQQGSRWQIRPAQKNDGTTFARIFIDKIPPGLKNWYTCRNAHPIWVKLGKYDYQKVRGGFINVKYTQVLEARATATAGFQEAVLAYSGRMNKKLREAVIFPPDTKAEPLEVDDDLLYAYKEQISQEQEKLLGKDGALVPHQPVFYLIEKNKVVAFGHVMMFRLPYERSPKDFIPLDLQRENAIDLAEAIFGFVAQSDTDRRGACAGRVFFEDATLESGQGNVWLCDEPITPRILASPKPTTFQHYLTQQQPDEVDTGRTDRNGNPKTEVRLDHYASPPPHQTTLRGNKLYWHHGAVSADDIREPDQAKIDKAKKQYTQIKPVKTGVTFRFRIYFENLTEVELGALLWVLQLPEGYCHKLGMGKPLGMGAVRIIPNLFLFERASRYEKLFDGDTWFPGDRQNRVADDFISKFEESVLQNIAPVERGQAKRLAEVERIKMLLAMLQFPGPGRDLTCYMEIEHGPQKVNEYKDRPVLPDPLHISLPTGSNSNAPTRRASPSTSRQGRQAPRKS